MSVKIYTAQSMTGHLMDEIVARAKRAKKVFNGAGIQVLDPVLAEHVPNEKQVLIDKPLNVLKDYWHRDKEMIQEAHVLVDITPEDKSEGVAHEIAYARYCLWKPVVRVYKQDSKPASMIAVFEDDLIVHSLEEAAVQINKYWGSWGKRLLWRLLMLNRCVPRWAWHQFCEFK